MSMPNLRKDISDISLQMADMATQTLKNVPKRALVTFIDDDGDVSFLTKLKPIYDANSATCSIAVNLGNINGNVNKLTMAQLHILQDGGFEILNHGTLHHGLDGMTDQQMMDEVVASQNTLKAEGFPSYKHFIYPNGTVANLEIGSFAFAKKYCKSGINTYALPSDKKFNSLPIDQFCINRRHVPDETLANMELYVDQAIANNGWVIFYTHAWMTAVTAEIIANVDALIKYIQSKSVSIVSVDSAINELGNIIDTDTGSTGLKVSNSGATNMPPVISPQVIFNTGTTTTFDKVITDYVNHSITQTVLSNVSAVNAPTPSIGGTLITTRNDLQSPLCYQQYRPYNSDTIYNRRALTDTTWSVWVATYASTSSNSTISITGKNGLNVNTKLVTDYALNTIQYELCSVSNNPNLPDLTAGVLITYRISSQYEFCYQEYNLAGSSKVFKRWGIASGAWSSTWLSNS